MLDASAEAGQAMVGGRVVLANRRPDHDSVLARHLLTPDGGAA
jgi:hypothetical protein